MDAEELARPIVERAGLTLYDVRLLRVSGRSILRITVDRPGGVDLDTLAEVSEKLSGRLDLEGYGNGRYSLEVSTPGIERPLRSPEHFELSIGQQVKVKTDLPVDGERIHAGTLVRVDGSTIVIAVGDAERRLDLAGVTSARTVADWAAELKGASA